MIDVLIPFLFGLMVGAGGGVMIAALLVASRDTPPQPRETDARIGKWIVLTDKTVKCPKCGKCFADAYDMDHADRFCRNCGECMEGEQ